MKLHEPARQFCFFVVVACAWLPLQAASAGPLDEQRDLFRKVHGAAELGDWSAFEKLPAAAKQQLRDYALWPDLRSTYLKATIESADHGEIDAFLTSFGTLKPASELRYRYALHLARTGDQRAFLDIYQSFYQGRSVARLDCLALQAELAKGRETRVLRRAVDLWLVGRSQVDECDSVFAWLKQENLLGPTEYRQRFALAIDERNFTLARWIGRSIDEQHAHTASQWLQAQSSPADFVRGHKRRDDGEAAREQLVYAIERVTYADSLVAEQLWRKIRKRYPFSEKQKLLTERHIALWMARDNLPAAYAHLRRLPEAAQNDEVARWRARTSLRNEAWQTLLADIARLSATEQTTEEWRYWRAMALLRTGQQEPANAELTALAAERSYYGFLAADEINAPYQLQDSDVPVDESIIADIATKPGIVRARELYCVGLDGRGRSEWDAVIAYLSDDQKLQAAILADRWGWHSRAIATAARVGEYDDLSLRYPLAFRKTFQKHSQLAQIPSTWAYGVARSESLFMRDARSRAGAIGLMQLMPATGKRVAQSIALPYSGLNTLTNPESNIRLGTTYLGQMADRYGGNRVLATAAYNAGPHRVDKWLPAKGSEDARVWIENIPFNETRKYVRRVLTAETIFHWRLTGETRRLTARLPRVRALSDKSQQLARR